MNIKKNQLKDFQKLLQKTVFKNQIISSEVAKEIAELSLKVQDTVSCLIDRNGKVRHYYIGDLYNIKDINAQLAREGSSFLGQLQIVSANPKKKKIDEAELLLMKRYHFDLFLFIHSNSHSLYSKSKGHYLEFADYCQLCYLKSGEPPWEIGEIATIKEISEINKLELIEKIEEDLAKNVKTLKIKTKETAILVGLANQDSFDELEGLADTAGAEILYRLTQNMKTPDSRFFIGSGKINKLRLLIEKYSADLVIFDGELSSSQCRNIERELRIAKVLDRTELILDIFAQRAKSNEGKLQVELAQLKYLAPRLAGGYKAMSKLGGGIGTRGPGETKIEVDRRRIKERINYLEKKVEEVSKVRNIQRRARKENFLATVSLVGYTNAGKSTLFQAITNEEVFIENKLFATLDPTIRKLNYKNKKPFLLSDTVGFIQKLPTTLVDAFRATLEEICESELILLVLDASNKLYKEHLKVIEKILEELGIRDKKRLLVFNKIDLLSQEERDSLENNFKDSVLISAQKKNNIESLINKIVETLE